ncbi:MAG: hypothetical protein JHC31_14550 [Sulfurihydrogenibium sp.]|jgi:hypothetical protein|nr:hypothetical protein [Sulfurihydrogenibium sp.]
MRNLKVLRSEEVANVTVTLEEAEKNYLIKIKYLSSSVTIGKYRKDRDEALIKVQSAFEKLVKKLNDAVDRGVKLTTVQFL